MYLIEFEDEYKDMIENYVLSDEQLIFTDEPKDCVELSNIDSERHSILTIEKDELVTFFVLHEKSGVEPYSNNQQAILLRAFSTDFRHQGKGYAKQSLLLLPEFVRTHYAIINEIVLAVNVKNTAAQKLYKKCGFVDQGVRKMGRKDELIIMSYYL